MPRPHTEIRPSKTRPAPLATRTPEVRAIDAHIGQRLRQRREALNMSQNALAQKLGISYQQIQEYEHGRDRIGAGYLLVLANTLAVPVSYFYPDWGRNAIPTVQAGIPQPLTEECAV